ncbi:MAG: CPCC family cysteine-rich protein [bacterium]
MSDTPHSDKLLPCPCCGSKSISSAGGYEICPVCGWEDDPTQAAEPEYKGGANRDSLNEARSKWQRRSLHS